MPHSVLGTKSLRTLPRLSCVITTMQNVSCYHNTKEVNCSFDRFSFKGMNGRAVALVWSRIATHCGILGVLLLWHLRLKRKFQRLITMLCFRCKTEPLPKGGGTFKVFLLCILFTTRPFYCKVFHVTSFFCPLISQCFGWKLDLVKIMVETKDYNAPNSVTDY